MAKSLNPSPPKRVNHDWIIESQEVKGDDGYIHTFFQSREFPHRTLKKNQWVSTLEMVAKADGNGQFSYRFLLKTKCGNRPTLQSARYKASIYARNTHDNSLQPEIISFEKEKNNFGNAVTFQVDFDAKNILSYFDDTKDSPDLLIKIAINEVKKRPGKPPVITARTRSANLTSLSTNGKFSSDEPEIEHTRVERPDEITSTVNEIDSGSSNSTILRMTSPTATQKPIKPTITRSKYIWSSDDDFLNDFSINRKVMDKNSPPKRAKASTHEDMVLYKGNGSSQLKTPNLTRKRLSRVRVKEVQHPERSPTIRNLVQSQVLGRSVTNYNVSDDSDFKESPLGRRNKPKVDSHHSSRNSRNDCELVSKTNSPRHKRKNTSRKMVDMFGSSSEDEDVIPNSNRSEIDQAFRNSQRQLGSGSSTRSYPSRTSSDEATGNDNSFSRIETKNGDAQMANTDDDELPDIHMDSSTSNFERPITTPSVSSTRTGKDDYIKQGQLNSTKRLRSLVSKDSPQNRTLSRSSHNEDAAEDQHLVIRKPIDKFFQSQRSK